MDYMLIEERMLNFEQWTHKAIPQYHTHYPMKPPIHCTQEVNLLIRYLEDIATFSTLTTNAPPKTWLLFATDYITDARLLNVIRTRIANYHPDVWDDKHQARMAKREAFVLSGYLHQYDSTWQEIHASSTDE